MSAAEAAVRTVQYAAVLALFGAAAFSLYVPRPRFHAADRAEWRASQAVRRDVWRIEGACLVAAVLSGALWFVLETARMSGLPLERALSGPAPGIVLRDTLFGQVFTVRFALALLVGALLVRGRRGGGAGGFPVDDIARAALAGGLLLALAWSGHAAGDTGVDRYLHLAADVLHLLAAGAWLGALPPLALMLARATRSTQAGPRALAAQATQRFSHVGVLSVGTLVLTGGINAWYLVGNPAALVGTAYGRLLLSKLALFAAMVALAAVNRTRLLPHGVRAATDDAGRRANMGLRRIARNAVLETVLGAAIVAIVAALGTMVPSAHVSIVWPFPVTLDWEAGTDGYGQRMLILGFGACGVAAAGVAALAARRRHRTLLATALVASVAAFGACAYALTVPAYPTTYAVSPVRYAVPSIARGATLFHDHCATCHGAEGRGDGPAAAALPRRPANLAAEHLLHRRSGDLYWWLSQGIPGTPMPGFGGRLGDAERWDLINFLKALADAEEAKALTGGVEAWRPITAPDFTFEIGRGPQESLVGLRGEASVLLVFCTLPASLPRLVALAESRALLARAGLRIVAVVMDSAAPAPIAGGALIAVTDPSLLSAYALFLRGPLASPASSAPAHVELLIDREGYLRARRIGLVEHPHDAAADLLRQLDILNHEEPHRAASTHAH